MASCCKGQIGSLNADIFAERVNSIYELIMTDDSTLFTDNLFNKLITLQMNAGFIEHMCEHYLDHIKVDKPFCMTVVRDNE